MIGMKRPKNKKEGFMNKNYAVEIHDLYKFLSIYNDNFSENTKFA